MKAPTWEPLAGRGLGRAPRQGQVESPGPLLRLPPRPPQLRESVGGLPLRPTDAQTSHPGLSIRFTGSYLLPKWAPFLERNPSRTLLQTPTTEPRALPSPTPAI